MSSNIDNKVLNKFLGNYDPKKLRYYKNNIDHGLNKPQPFSLSQYTLNVNESPAIKAIGYATDHKDYPLRLMDFERRMQSAMM